MVGIADIHDADAHVLRLLDRQLHGAVGRHDAEGALGVQQCAAREIPDRLYPAPGIRTAGLHAVGIEFHALHTVGLQAGQLGRHQAVRHDGGILRRNALLLHDRRYGGLELFRIYAEHFTHGRHLTSTGLR